MAKKIEIKNRLVEICRETYESGNYELLNEGKFHDFCKEVNLDVDQISDYSLVLNYSPDVVIASMIEFYLELFEDGYLEN